VAAKNPNFAVFLPFFGLRHLLMSPIGINLRKLSTGAQLQAFDRGSPARSFTSKNFAGLTHSFAVRGR